MRQGTSSLPKTQFASSTKTGLLKASDWTAFNAKQAAISLGLGYIPYGTGTTGLSATSNATLTSGGAGYFAGGVKSGAALTFTGTNSYIDPTAGGDRIAFSNTSGPGSFNGFSVINVNDDGTGGEFFEFKSNTPADACGFQHFGVNGAGSSSSFYGLDYSGGFMIYNYIGPQCFMAGAQGSNPRIDFSGDGTDGASGPIMVIATDGSANARVGIGMSGTAVAGHTLDVNGDIWASGRYYDSTVSAGTSSQVLTSTGSGTAWKNKYTATGTATLVSGTKAITISGLTSGNMAFVQLTTPGGTLGAAYKAVCTTNTLTITAVTVAGVTVTTDTSTLNYFIP